MLSDYNRKMICAIVEALGAYLSSNIDYPNMIRTIEANNNCLEDTELRKKIYTTLRATYEHHSIMLPERRQETIEGLYNELKNIL